MASAQWQGRWYLVVLVMAGTVLSLIDRNLLGLMVESIKSDLQLSDTQMGLLLGPAFVIFYLLFGFPFGWLSDRFDRRLVIAAGIIIWSLATGASAFAATFAVFFAARSMVGAGEAALTPAGMSMMGDSFSRERLPVAISIYSLSFHLGGAGAFLVGGTILKVFAGGVALPFIGDVAAWQLTLLVMVPPGFLVALLFLFMKQPPRRAHAALALKTRGLTPAADHPGRAAEEKSTTDLLAFIRLNPVTMSVHLLASSVLVLGTSAVISWTPAYFTRTFALAEGDVALLIGLIIAVFGPVGALGGGWLTRYLEEKRGDLSAPWLVMAVSAFLTPLVGVLVYTGQPLAVTLAAFVPASIFGSLSLGIMHAGLQMIAPSALRGRLTAIFLFFQTLIGVGLGPFLTGLVTEHVFGDPSKVGLALISVTMPLSLSAGAALLIFRQAFSTSYQRIKAAEA